MLQAGVTIPIKIRKALRGALTLAKTGHLICFSLRSNF